MRRYGFVKKGVQPADVYELIKSLLESEDFKITSEEKRETYLRLHARRSSAEKTVFGRARDVEFIVAGTKGRFEVELHAGISCRDLLAPAIEGIDTPGVAPADELQSAREFEEGLWEQVVNKIDPSLKVCKLDGMVFKTQDELDKHLQAIDQQRKQGPKTASRPSLIVTASPLGGLAMITMPPGLAEPPQTQDSHHPE